MTSSLVSVIIATKNEETNILRVLHSISNQTYPETEIIIVDNFSTDNTAKLAKEAGAKVFLQGEERSEQRNRGAAKANGTYLLFLDADMELPPTTIVACVKHATKNSCVALVIPEKIKGKGLFVRIKSLEKRIYLNEPMIEAARFFRTSAFKQVNGYNNALIAAEDWDLSQRIQKVGKMHRAETFLYHYESSFIRELRHKLYYARHIHKYAFTHPMPFAYQSGLSRLKLFWKKRHILFSDPFAGCGLLIIKALEFTLYLSVKTVLKYHL